MKNTLLILATVLLTAPASRSQEIERESWDSKPALHPMEHKYNEESAIIVLDKRRVEYVDEKEGVAVYRTLHRVIHINDDKGIESFNRVYLPVSDNNDIVDIFARTILPDGKIIQVSKENIKDLKEEEDVYKIFAMEGLVKGCEVEFYYTYKRNTGFFGSETFQGRLPVLDARFDLVAPQRLIFELRPFNSAIKPADTVVNEKKWITIAEKSIPGVEEEKYSAYQAGLKRYEYKLSYNTSRKTNDRLFTWDELAKRVYANYVTVTEKETKRTNDLVSDMKVKDLATETDKIVAVENYIKTNFTSRDDIGGEEAANLEKIIKSKLASHTGIVRLYSAVFRQLGIPHEFVLAGDRNKFSVEKNFENWNNTDNAVIYFPSLKKYMAPTLSEYRFPWIDPNWAGTNAFFCKSTTIGEYTTAFGEVRMIPLEDYTKTVINTEAEVSLNQTNDTILVSISQIYSGYSAAAYRAIFNYNSEENIRMITKEMIKFGTNSENVISSKVENKDFESYHQNKPFILSAVVKASELLERAGNKIIVKIGDIIGPQVEMYQEKPRQFPMEIDFPHVLERRIRFTIPEGYILKNPDDIKISHVSEDKGQTSMGFTSSYEIRGNVADIHIIEEYRRTSYPLSQYEEFKKVINAAADFNKVVLVLEKK
ncbi:MAG: DUF3857 and transglutaminase domain-containing protein [Sphingobacteriales bacterium]|nr:DUF3857 and transglutaminase domain-containing protein [Sphingobacteriales bacterium]